MTKAWVVLTRSLFIFGKSMQKQPTGYCCICGNLSELTFEHIPPKSSFNSNPIFIKNFDNQYNETSRFYGLKQKSNKGLGSYSLCKSCNNLTGAWYGESFSEFTKQGMEIILNHKPGAYFISGTYNIRPLNVIKQIISMHLSVDKSGSLRGVEGLQNFVLEKSNKNLPKTITVYLYSTLSKIKRMHGYSMVWENGKTNTWSEINFQPFGYFLAVNSQAAHEDMININHFTKYSYDEVIEIKLETRYLEVKNNHIGTYNDGR